MERNYKKKKTKIEDLEYRIKLLEDYIELQSKIQYIQTPQVIYANLNWCPFCRVYNCGLMHVTC